MNHEAIIEIKNLNKTFGDNHVLRDFSMTLTRGENLAVLGKSGSGKSVLIKCIVRLIEPDSGEIRVFGEDVLDMGHHKLDELRARVGFLFQSNALYDSMTIRENLEFPLRRHGPDNRSEQEDEVLILEALDNVGLRHTIDMMPSELSGGMRKRIALARTLILRPDIILYDEPTTGLDPITAREISNLIMEIQKKYKASSIIISHDMNCIRTTADRVMMLIDGRCYANGHFEELQRLPDREVHSFFEETRI